MKCKYRVGDLKWWITLRDRALKGVVSGESFTEEFTDKPLDVQAKIETLTGKTVFDGSGIERAVSHRFVIRYDEAVTNQTWIEFKAKNFNIVTFENVDEEDEWLVLLVEERGASDKVVNHL